MIEGSKKNPPERLLAGMSIPNVGKNTAKTLMRHFKSFDALMAADREELKTVPDIGEITADSIYEYFKNEGIISLVNNLKSLGVNMEADSDPVSDDSLSGRTYVITGNLNAFTSRDELIRFIESRGGKVSGSVSKKTYALINNDSSSTSGKNKKALELGIKIITEEELLSELK